MDLISTKALTQFSFYQLLRSLEYGGYSCGKHLKLRPSFLTSFPPSDIRRGQIKGESFEIELSFMGLYGVDAPLPHYFIQACSHDDDRSASLRRFLDIFNQRLYQLLFSAWKKYQPLVQFEQGDQQYLKLLRALSGGALNSKDRAEYGAASLLGARQHHAAGLQAVLQDFLVSLPVRVQEFLPRWLKVTGHPHLGSRGSALGANLLLGETIYTCTEGLRVQVGPVTLETAITLFPEASLGARVGYLMKRYLAPGLRFDLCLQIQTPKDKLLRLGSDQMYLGGASWIGVIRSGQYAVYFADTRFHQHDRSIV